MIRSRGEKIYGIINSLFFFIVGIIILIPIGFVLKMSLDVGPPGELKLSLIPREISPFYYRLIIQDSGIYRPFLNSVYVTVLGTAISLALNTMGAYTLAARKLPGSRFFTYFLIITMVFNGGLLPLYIVVVRLGLINKLITLVLLGASSGWSMILIKNFYRSIPDSLPESARIDGAGEFFVYRMIILPLSTPVIAAIGLFTAVGFWNTFFNAVIFMNDPAKYTFPVKLREMISVQQMQYERFELAMSTMGYDYLQRNLKVEGLSSAIIIVSMMPIIMIYPFLQRHFVKGILIGSLKG